MKLRKQGTQPEKFMVSPTYMSFTGLTSPCVMGIPPPSQQQQGSSRHPLLLVEDLGSVFLAHGLGFVQSGGCCRWFFWWENVSLFFIGTLACPIAREHTYSWGLWRRVVEYVIFTQMHFSFGKCGPVGMCCSLGLPLCEESLCQPVGTGHPWNGYYEKMLCNKYIVWCCTTYGLLKHWTPGPSFHQDLQMPLMLAAISGPTILTPLLSRQSALPSTNKVRPAWAAVKQPTWQA